MRVGEEIGKVIVERYFMDRKNIRTPMNEDVIAIVPKVPLCAIVSTKDDFEFLGKGLSRILENSVNGYMDFEGRRGREALNSHIAHMELPEAKGQSVHTLVIAKAVLATGCTAVHLAKTAQKKYMPRNILIVSVFYSEKGVLELQHEVPNADIVVVGKPDSVDENGMLTPGVGNLDQRLKA